MSGGPSFYITRSTTLLQIDSSIYNNATVYLSSLNSPGAIAYFSSINGRVSLIRSLKRGAPLLFFRFPLIPLAVLPEAKQAQINTE